MFGLASYGRSDRVELVFLNELSLRVNYCLPVSVNLLIPHVYVIYDDQCDFVSLSSITGRERARGRIYHLID